MTDIYELFFELSNEDRVSILGLLMTEQLNLTNISKTLDLRNQEASRHLFRLENTGLISKNTNGTYQTTNFAKLILAKQKELSFLLENKEYFNNHSVEQLPSHLLMNLGVLSNSVYIDDTLIALQIVKRIIDEAEESLYRLSDQFLMVILDPIVAATERGVKYSFIYSADIQLPPRASDTVRLRNAKEKGLFFSYTHKNVIGFIVMSEKEVLVGFPQKGGKYDYTGFNSTDEAALRWCKELFDHHYADRLPPVPLWRNIP